MLTTHALAATDPTSPLAPYTFERREVKPTDVRIKILYSGICHSDIHTVRGEWGPATYPLVPGHEIVGQVIEVGSEVTRYRVGDTAGVGVMVDSCRTCGPCARHMEQYCVEGMTGTYNATERDESGPTQGGYATQIVTDQRYVYSIAPSLSLPGVAPLLCAGITTYSPLRYAGVTVGTRVAVVGLGGLGHMAVKFAVSFGARVTVISTSESKRSDALRLGAHDFIHSTGPESLTDYDSSFDVVLDAVSAPHDYTPYLELLDLQGKLMVVGLPSVDPHVKPFALIKNRRSITGSMIGGTVETQEMLDYCAANGITADVEVIPASQVNAAYERVISGDVKYRFVIDVGTMG